MRTGKKDKLRDIDNDSCYEALGSNLSKSILAFYEFTGCDKIGRFSKKLKFTWWNVYVDSNDTITEAFSKHGDGKNLRTLETLESLEKLVVKVYGESKYSVLYLLCRR